MMEHQEQQLEEERLAHVLDEIDTQLTQSRDQIARRESEMVAVQRDVFEDGARSGGSLSSADGFESLIELNQSMVTLTNMAVTQDNLAKKISRLEAMRPSPYFGRIDFLFNGDKQSEPIYIGRAALLEEDTAESLVYDWRSPIASVFYRFLTGPAYYMAPVGRIDGDVMLKRQYEIKDSKLAYFFDTDMTVNDGILKQLLSQNTSPQMRAIVETIQRDQDLVIRNLDADLLMIQGVAGSGKTAIALHRAAFLMYEGLTNALSSRDILILSPNRTFSQYIAGVLPELGEENVRTLTFDELLHDILDIHHMESQAAFLERAIGSSQKAFIRSCMTLKTSEGFRKILDRFVADIPTRFINYHDIRYGGRLLISKQELKTRVRDCNDLLLGTRLEQVESRVLDHLGSSLRKNERAAVTDRLQQFTRLNLLELYRRFWEDDSYFQGTLLDDALAQDLPAIRRRTLNDLHNGRLGYDDAILLLYIHLKIYGSRAYRSIRQIIIDEAQDYYPLQYNIFHLLFPNAKATILGDVNQSLTRRIDADFYDQVQSILAIDNTVRYTLTKSFRCSSEILRFGLQFLNEAPRIDAFNRSGEAVTIQACEDFSSLCEAIEAQVDACRAKGYESICLITKTEAACQRLHRALRDRITVHQLRSHDDTLQGTLMMPVSLTKGLEFDAVILCDADATTYRDDADASLLYIIATRALHHLAVLCEGNLSPLINTEKEDTACMN